MNAGLYRSVWRWHFYAGLFVMPFVLLLSVTGAIYLFKPQIDRWEERAWRDLPPAPGSPVAQVDAALADFPGARVDSYRVPERVGDAALIHLALAQGGMRDVFVSPSGRVLGSLDPEARISAVVSRLHGNLLIGRMGDWLVELAASWAIVMIVTGLYLWWPRGRGLAGVIWPRARAGLRDLHAVTGFWVAGLALILLVSGLPWAGIWGSAFTTVRAGFGLVKDAPDWKTGAAASHADHDHHAMAVTSPLRAPLERLPAMVALARAERLAFPALIRPPGVTDARGSPSPGWVVKSEAQNRTLQRSITIDAASGRELSRTGFADKHPIDRLVNYGISWHEGQLFGWVNQLVGVVTAAALLALVVTSFLLWRRRRPAGLLGAPPVPGTQHLRGVTAIIVALCVLLPMVAISLTAVLLLEWLVLRRVPATAAWLGLRAAPVRNRP
ncbi:MAG: hypothetical protein JWN21_33 [Sphingomonas bacterium]|uniref:PepSY-associated TM helix domain-containing protein n=1 Tax=Sphingomonas bacterium TaxID=1895847 RepID=UPI0026080B0C|nr:PepSY domain-containing protein [Sphingomonas bacterium]MDB5694490.1 hypothetical protein [Sphingomonas bacterium]